MHTIFNVDLRFVHYSPIVNILSPPIPQKQSGHKHSAVAYQTGKSTYTSVDSQCSQVTIFHSESITCGSYRKVNETGPCRYP